MWDYGSEFVTIKVTTRDGKTKNRSLQLIRMPEGNRPGVARGDNMLCDDGKYRVEDIEFTEDQIVRKEGFIESIVRELSEREQGEQED